MMSKYFWQINPADTIHKILTKMRAKDKTFSLAPLRWCHNGWALRWALKSLVMVDTSYNNTKIPDAHPLWHSCRWAKEISSLILLSREVKRVNKSAIGFKPGFKPGLLLVCVLVVLKWFVVLQSSQSMVLSKSSWNSWPGNNHSTFVNSGNGRAFSGLHIKPFKIHFHIIISGQLIIIPTHPCELDNLSVVIHHGFDVIFQSSGIWL